MFQDMNPLSLSTATFEILLMLLVAFILGLIIGYLLRKNKNTSSTEESIDVSGLETEIASLRSANATLDRDLKECRAANKQEKVEPIIPPKKTIKPAAEQSFAVSEEDKKNAERLGFAVAKGDKKDDLKRISGVGPFIEKKMNALGIYTFEQVSEFSKETIDKVTEAIEFFPGRIERDDWVGQAKKLMNE